MSSSERSRTAASPGRDPVSRRDLGNGLRIILLSAFLLFLEVMLVRWLGTELRIFAYFKNLTLIACFLGIGIGCLRADRPPRFWLTFPYLTVVVGLVVVPQRLGVPLHDVVTTSLGSFNDLAVWTWSAGESRDHFAALLSLGFLIAVFGLTALTCVPGGQLLGHLFRSSEHNLIAYTANILGSILGVWLFSLVSFASLPPFAWLAVLVILAASLVTSREDVVPVGLAALLVVTLGMAERSGRYDVIWSPYQKLQVSDTLVENARGETVNVGFSVAVNGTFYQRAVNFDPAFLGSHRDLWPDLGDVSYAAYNLAYRMVPEPERVLTVGTGTGNDVAAALRNGAGRVDAVEIDPEIVRLGRLRHPERPYSDPRVRVVVDDARAFFHRASPGYDLIVFGALDSHTLNSSLTNLRVDNFVYTVDAFREVRDLLAPDGVLWVVFAVERPFIESRIAGMLTSAFGSSPVVFKNSEARSLRAAGGGTTFVIARDGATIARLARDPVLSSLVDQSRLWPRKDAVEATDDWPYLYLEGRSIPMLYRIVTVAIVMLTLVAIRPTMRGWRRTLNLVYFLLGAAFLLVEVQIISKLSLLFGSTWLVSAAAITGVLVMIFAANVVAILGGGLGFRSVVAALVVTLLVGSVFPFRELLGLPWFARLVLAGAVMSLPIFFAGMLFAKLFADDPQPHVALAWNLLGAIVGGLAESLSFVLGLNALGLVALGFYLIAALLLARHAGRSADASREIATSRT